MGGWFVRLTHLLPNAKNGPEQRESCLVSSWLLYSYESGGGGGGGAFVSWKTPKGLFAFLSCKFRTWWLCRCDFTPVRQLARSQAMLITGQSLLHSHTRYTCMLRTEAWCLCTHQTHPTLLYPSNSQAVIPSSPSFALIVRVSLCVSAEPVTCLGFDRSVCIGT